MDETYAERVRYETRRATNVNERRRWGHAYQSLLTRRWTHEVFEFHEYYILIF